MKTQEEMVKEGYSEDWACECSSCHSWNCHRYKDHTICFDCINKEKNKTNFLFVCTSAMDRSPCAASLFEKSKKYAKFAGISPGAEIPLTREAIIWADVIFTMEPEHQRYVLDNFAKEIRMGCSKDVILLNVGNDYKRYDKELEELLRKKLEKEGFL